MSVDVCVCAFAELANDKSFSALTDEYANESAMSGLPRPKAHLEMYQQLERAGLMHTVCAYDGQLLVGFIVLLVSLLPHYSEKVASLESFFVGSAHRKSGAGLALLHTAEKVAKEHGALGLLVSAPHSGKLADVMARMPGYRETNRVFFRALA